MFNSININSQRSADIKKYERPIKDVHCILFFLTQAENSNVFCLLKNLPNGIYTSIYNCRNQQQSRVIVIVLLKDNSRGLFPAEILVFRIILSNFCIALISDFSLWFKSRRILRLISLNIVCNFNSLVLVHIEKDCTTHRIISCNNFYLIPKPLSLFQSWWIWKSIYV